MLIPRLKVGLNVAQNIYAAGFLRITIGYQLIESERCFQLVECSKHFVSGSCAVLWPLNHFATFYNYYDYPYRRVAVQALRTLVPQTTKLSERVGQRGNPLWVFLELPLTCLATVCSTRGAG